MLLRLQLLGHALGAAVAVARDRLRRGPARSGWGWWDELVAVGMKRHFARMAPLPWARQREFWGAMALPVLPGFRALRLEPRSLAGMKALALLPRAFDPAQGLTVLYLHGGAYLFGALDEYGDFLARLAGASGARVVAFEYRLAPEHPFPAAFEDALAAYQALLREGVAPERLVLAGDSAGGGLTAALLVALRERGLPLPARAALIAPWVDLGAQGGSLVGNAAFDVFSPELVAHWTRAVLAGADAADPRISPLHADLRGLPPLLLQVGGVEMLLDQDVAFAEMARAAGVAVTLRIWDDCIHDWLLYAPVLDSGRRALREVADFVRGAPAP
jgi:acetyl esterase/lipase